MLKRLSLIIILILCINRAYGQTLTVPDLIRLASTSDTAAATRYLKEKHFMPINSKVEFGVVASHFSRKNSNIVETVIFRREKNYDHFFSMQYEVTPTSYVDILKKQLLQAGFSMVSHIIRSHLETLTYSTETYRALIVVRTKDLPIILYLAKI